MADTAEMVDFHVTVRVPREHMGPASIEVADFIVHLRDRYEATMVSYRPQAASDEVEGFYLEEVPA